VIGVIVLKKTICARACQDFVSKASQGAVCCTAKWPPALLAKSEEMCLLGRGSRLYFEKSLIDSDAIMKGEIEKKKCFLEPIGQRAVCSSYSLLDRVQCISSSAPRFYVQ
jgi:hypothetical protein